MNEYQYAKEKSFLTLTSVSSSYRINAWKEDLSRKTHFLSDSHGIQRNFTNTNGKTTRKLKEIIDQECKVEEYLDAIPITNYISHHRRNYTCDTTEKGHITKETHSTEIDDRKKEIEKSLTDGSKDSRETGRNNLNVPKEKYKITKGRPTHRYCAKTHDIIDKELEIWHNSHNSTLKWERIKSGLYLVGGSKVNLIKTNGILYVKSGEHRKNFDKMHIAKFVEEKQFCQSKKRI
ncbi:hypothetical protein BEWA_043640 [Theileria equi strain WA]|uniref:Uncharacterized protein n=1 Tax=Theileria equi strain WA TaxID=1537102 RepID=L1LGT0_THEEQ|nr:hypothetical protein BEWA_043640 [Theileria equi strain WA]EKX74323.1 hypothetical protein BEWA_043640 [Theileria equi strain WA]|eukprot:XP_004833775.1 hypothetical protein BEWA_043640 [Theileria equi strain WA]